MYTCKKCDQEFNTKSLLGKHIYHEHKAKEQPEDNGQNEELVIPKERVEELQLLSKGQPVRLICEGIVSDQGLVVHTIKYVR